MRLYNAVGDISDNVHFHSPHIVFICVNLRHLRTEMKRLFFALWPDTKVRSQLVEIVELLPVHSGRRINPENLHITLVFLGNVREQVIPELTAGAQRLNIPEFSLRINQNGWWKRPEIAWLAPEYAPAPLLNLVEQINQLVKQTGLPVEKRSYQPHLTIARKVNRPVDSLRYEPIDWNIKDFCLVESVTHEHGVRYQVRQSWPLVRNTRREGFKG